MAIPAERRPQVRPGIREPTSGTPARAPGSVRRTTTIDIVRPDGLTGPLILTGHGRDVRTGRAGTAEVLDEAFCEGVVDFVNGRKLTALSTHPARSLNVLLDGGLTGGFRSLLDTADPQLHEEASLLYQLLDDFPVATLISGHALAASARDDDEIRRVGGAPYFPVNLCAGFVEGGVLSVEVQRVGHPPAADGPVAPPLVTDGDGEAWHPRQALPPHSMRRARRIDVSPGAPVLVDAFFRDSYLQADGIETVVHEYTLEATVDAVSLTLATCEARPRVLPSPDCPVAVASAGRLVGQPVSDLRKHVRATFRGPSTCTHLNDMLRALADVPVLLPRLAETR